MTTDEMTELRKRLKEADDISYYINEFKKLYDKIYYAHAHMSCGYATFDKRVNLIIPEDLRERYCEFLNEIINYYETEFQKL